MTRSTDGFGARNCLRLDFDALTFFVPIFRNPQCRAPHAHEDLLSYVVYAHTSEVLVDRGRESYAHSQRACVLASSHNGLCDPAHPVSPRARFYFNRRLRSEPVKTAIDRSSDGSVRIAAENTLLGLRRSLTLRPQGNHGVIVEEVLERDAGLAAPVFLHLFADEQVTMVEPGIVVHETSGCTIAYAPSMSGLLLSAAVRSPAYGRREPAKRVTTEFAGESRLGIRWTIACRT